MIATEPFLHLLGRVSLQASGLALVVLAAQFVFRPWLSPRWRCALWWLVAVRLLIPFSPQSSLSIFNVLPGQAKATVRVEPLVAQPQVTSVVSIPQNVKVSTDDPVRNEETTHQGSASLTPQSSATTPTIVAKSASSRMTLPIVLLVIWITGVVALCSQLLIATIRMHRRLSGLVPLTDPEILDRLNECRSQMRVSKSLQIFETSSVTSPALYGFLHARLLLPLGFTRKFSGEEQKFVFLHELAHVKRHDILLNWVLAGLQIIHWFNPLLWIAAFRFRTDRELACDALALDRAGEHHSEAYGRTILRLLQDFTRPATVPALVGILEDKRQLKHRITAIANFNPLKSGAWLAIVLLMTLSALALTDAKDTKPKLPPVVPLPLNTFFTKGENELFATNKVWMAVPKGTQDFGGIEFHLDGLIQLLGSGLKAEGRDFRTRVVIPLQETNKVGTKQIVINRGTNVAAIHLISGTAYDDAAGTKVVEIVWRYADKSSRRTPIEYGVHVRDWWRPRYEEPAHLPYANTKVVWTGSHPDAEKAGKRLRFYRISFDNPQPQKQLVSLEFQSAMNRPGMYIAALTLDPLKLGERPDDSPDLEESDPPLTGTLQTTVTDLEGHPIAGARIEGKARQDAGKPTQANFTKSFFTDSNGTAMVLRPTTGLERFEIAVSKDGFGGQKMIWDIKAGDAVPTSYKFKLDKGIVIGGVIVGPNGEAISGATVNLGRFWTGSDLVVRQGADVDFQTKKEVTDNAGRWITRNVPPELLGHIAVSVSHPDYLSTNFNVSTRPEVQQALRDATHQTTLAQGLQAFGRVLDEKENPIAGATVSVNLRSTPERQDVKADSDGRFSFKIVTAGNLFFSVTAKGKKPLMKYLPVTGGTEEILFRMVPGTVVRARVQNETGEPVPNTRVALENGSGGAAQTYVFDGTTDEEGRIVWDGAPDEPQKYYFGGPGYEQKRGQVLPPNVENIVTLRKERKVQGKVVVEGTREPVKKFTAGVGPGNGSDISRFYPDSPGFAQFSSENGEFSLTLNEDGSNTIVVKAPEYADKLQTLPIPVNGIVQITIELQPSASLVGVVVTPDGRPCPGVRLVITEGRPSLAARLLRGALESFTRNSKIVMTDNEGKFKLTSPPAVGIVVAVSSTGFAAVSLEGVRAAGGLVLQPYGRIEGTLSVAGEPIAGTELELDMSHVGLTVDPDSYSVTTDLNGRFTFESVPSGKVAIVRLVPTGKNAWRHSHNTEVVVEPGKTAKVNFGSTGGVLKGNIRFKTLLGPEAKVDITGLLTSPPRNFPQGLTDEQTKNLLQSAEWQQMRSLPSFAANVSANGIIQLDSIPPGTYRLTVTANRGEGDKGTASSMDGTVARGEMSVTIPADATPSSPINIGEIVLQSTEPVAPKTKQ